jgi:trans-L-3-hydroxyproline dehydratase
MDLERARHWTPPKDWLHVLAIDAHTGGEPLRVVIDGFPELPGDTILDRRRHARDRLDHLRTAIMWEPRGHADMYGCLVTPAVTPGAHFGVLFLHNEGYSTMCGHGIIAVTTVVLDTGVMPANEPVTTVRIDTPAGLVTAQARVSKGRVETVAFRNVPSFVVSLDDRVEVPGLGSVPYDLAFGGAFYAYVPAEAVGVRLVPEDHAALIERGKAIKRAVMDQRTIEHPFEPDLGFLYGTIFVGPPQGDGAHSRNVCVFAEGEVDRSPTGTGVSGRMAIHHARGEVGCGDAVVIESIVGSRFTGRVLEETRFGPYDAVIPEVEGSAAITGRNELWIDPTDPFRHGFILR